MAEAGSGQRRGQRTATRPRKAVNLALQGGGSHGAFTWGVLDRLLEDDRLDIEAISGTSAGAMNAVVLADGLMRGGPEAARDALESFWYAVSDTAAHSPFRRSPIDILMGNWSLDSSPLYLMFDLLNRVASPYDLNPLNLNPLRDLLESSIDFARVRACDRTKLFVSATNVETGRIRVFTTPEITVDSVLASACLPFLFQAVEIDGVPYWDGGYMGNPALFPFFNSCASRDVVLVQINPIERLGTPRNAREILNRVNEITFNASLARELRAINFVHRLHEEGRLEGTNYSYVLVHRIEADAEIKPLSASSKLNAERAFLDHLKAIGRAAAGAWLDANFAALGERSTVDVRALFA